MTNFERITESPEKLAEFLDELMSTCGCCIPIEVEKSVSDCDEKLCPHMKENRNCGFDTFEWLKEESE